MEEKNVRIVSWFTEGKHIQGGKGFNPYMHEYPVYLNWCEKIHLQMVLLAREAALWFSIDPCVSQRSQNPSGS